MQQADLLMAMGDRQFEPDLTTLRVESVSWLECGPPWSRFAACSDPIDGSAMTWQTRLCPMTSQLPPAPLQCTTNAFGGWENGVEPGGRPGGQRMRRDVGAGQVSRTRRSSYCRRRKEKRESCQEQREVNDYSKISKSEAG